MKISIIIPTYNRAKLLKRAIDSVVSQNFSDWELIVVDDGSQDETSYIMSGYKDQRIIYLKEEINKGVASARNKGVMKATGEVISFLDSDDEYLPDALKIISEDVGKTDETIGMVFFQIEMYEESDEKIVYIGKRGYLPKDSNWYYFRPSFEDLLLKKNVRNDMHRTYKSDTMKKYLFDERIKDHDTIHYANVAKAGVGCLYVNKSVVRVNVGRDDHLSHGRRDPKTWEYIYSLYFKDHEAVLKKYPLQYVMMALGMGITKLKLGKPSGLMWMTKGMVVSPTNFFKYIFKKL
jgi:glycosyltransferase involved in cell wall biosynthesis